jgi:heterotetrameric sarcosine oxidase delta subunit
VIEIPCPHCGPRNSSEFVWAGERQSRPDPGAGALQPSSATTTTPAEWRAYLYERRNPAGWTSEHWYHRFGCRRYLLVERHTVTNEVRRCEPAGSPEARP